MTAHDPHPGDSSAASRVLATISNGLAAVASSAGASLATLVGGLVLPADAARTASPAPGRTDSTEGADGHPVSREGEVLASDPEETPAEAEAVIGPASEARADQAAAPAPPSQGRGDAFAVPWSLSTWNPLNQGRPPRPNQDAPQAPGDGGAMAGGDAAPEILNPREDASTGAEASGDPLSSGTLAESLAVDASLIDRALKGLLDEIQGLDGAASRAIGDEATPLWLAGAGLAVAATVYARRRARRSQSVALAGRAGPSSWVPGLSLDAV